MARGDEQELDIKVGDDLFKTVAGRVFGQMIGPPWRLEHHSRMTGGRSWNDSV